MVKRWSATGLGASAACVLLCIAVAGCRSAPATAVAQPAPLAQAAVAREQPAPSDVAFMTGMITHHEQALVMARWALDQAHGTGAELRRLAARIDVSQRDDIEFMQRWLSERVTASTDDHHSHHDDHSLMPGMLSAVQLAELDAARGRQFDRLFLTFMIQHHRGAVTMVQQLLSSPGPRDGSVFRFASDVNSDQTAEIERMSRMLAALQ